MLKMMAADNDDAYNLTPAFILETVEVAREFVSKNLGNVTKVKGEWRMHVKVASFLAWPQERVKHALAQLAAFEQDENRRIGFGILETEIPQRCGGTGAAKQTAPRTLFQGFCFSC